MKSILFVFFIAMLFIFQCSHQESTPLEIEKLHRAQSIQSIVSVDDLDIIVNTTSDVCDFDFNLDHGVGPDGLLSLREAIWAARVIPGDQSIGFQIPITDPGFDGQVFTIIPTSAIPMIEDGGVILDGSTQTLFTGDTNPLGPEIVLDGHLLSMPATGIRFHSSNNHIHSFVIHSFPTSGILMDYANIHSNIVTGCYIGTDHTGTIKRANLCDGILLSGTNSGQHQVGGPEEWQRNIISGNTRDGIQTHFGVTDCLIMNNYIGMDRGGMNALGNGQTGTSFISDAAAPNGSHQILQNVISANGWDGIGIFSSSNNIIKGNKIGADVNGASGFGNEADGVRMVATGGGPVSGNVIGGLQIDESNLITNNFFGIIVEGDAASVSNQIIGNEIAFSEHAGIGIWSQASWGFLISQNMIHDNAELGIDLNIDGVTLNDAGDLDEGANGLLNFPELERVWVTSRCLIIKGSIDTENPQRIEFYASHSADESGFGEGENYIGSSFINPFGDFTGSFARVPSGTWITALTIDSNGNTSEFSAAVLVE